MAEHLSDELLHMRFDGELSKDEGARADAHLATCTHCSKQLNELSRLRELVVMSAQEGAREVDFDAMFGRIERGTREAPAPSLLERMRVWLEEMLEHKPSQLWVPAAGVLTAAALLIFASTADDGGEMAKRAPGPVTQDKPSQQANGRAMFAENQEQAQPQPAEPSAGASEGGSEVIDVDFGENTGTVFEIALADGISTPVVWINDEE